MLKAAITVPPRGEWGTMPIMPSNIGVAINLNFGLPAVKEAAVTQAVDIQLLIVHPVTAVALDAPV